MNSQRQLRSLGIGALVLLWATLPLHAWAGGNPASPGAPKTEAAAADIKDGGVREVDVDQAKVTLKHADIKSLDMPAMTMVFVVKDKAMLSGVKAGDKVRLEAVNDAGKYTITGMQVVR